MLAIESIDEIADMQGIKAQVAEITQRTMRGEIVFAESLRQRTALLKDLDQDALQYVYDHRVRLSPGAEKMLQRMKSAGLKTMVISGGFTFFTERIKSRLSLDYAAANTLDIQDGKLTGKVLGEIIGAHGKAAVLNKVREELGLKREQVIAIGDGANDLRYDGGGWGQHRLSCEAGCPGEGNLCNKLRRPGRNSQFVRINTLRRRNRSGPEIAA